MNSSLKVISNKDNVYKLFFVCELIVTNVIMYQNYHCISRQKVLLLS